MKLTLLALPLLSLFALAFAATPSGNDKAAVRQAVLDYVAGVYGVDPARIERSVHPGLTKHGFWKAKDKPGYAT
ncbi:MAG: nuclear transport factor 2 family protein, partial [Blastocatellia bacterium]|nr:nuclear transport factor 2 family protein [Blastocatellia bacterium]